MVKQQNRTLIIIYKLLVSFGLSLLFISLTYLLSALAFHLFTGQAYYGIVIDRMIKQLPFILLLLLCVNFCLIYFVKLISQSQLIYFMSFFLIKYLLL